ncbi:MAG TPA: NAD-binding protein, partial [Polyangiales bacterium]|nr:NAD-binding protein [Polyangiales bacterium]
EQPHLELRSLLRFLALLLAVVSVFSVLFHVIMVREGQSHSWLTGLYWTLTVMSTLGFGDITFQSDLGRGFTILVLISGMVLMLIVLPFAFIRFFYAPWLEAQLHSAAPRALPTSVHGHVIICRYDEVARALIDTLAHRRIPYVVIEPDAARAAELHRAGVRVVCGPIDARKTYDGVGFARARLLLANAEDVENANVTLTAREVDSRVEIFTTVLDADAVDVLELAGANRAIALRRHLGEHLASRVSVGNIRSHAVGRYRDLVIAEFPIRHTLVAGKTLAESQIRSRTGVTVPAIAKRGTLLPGLPDTVLREDCIGVAVGREEQVAALDALLGEGASGPVLVIGGGKVGRNAARALKRRNVAVHMLERRAELAPALEKIADRLVIGDASDLENIEGAGIAHVPSVILTTNDDATNIFLAIYCRKLNPSTIIVSRVHHGRNIEAIHRAGADFALSDPQFAVQSIVSSLEGRDLVLLGEGLELFDLPLPRSLAGTRLRDAGIRARTGLSVIAIVHGELVDGAPAPDHILQAGAHLLFVGTSGQADSFRREFG